ncbi:MAG: alpha/beta hydrolase [Candidatus Sericytochromatia bacterium]
MPTQIVFLHGQESGPFGSKYQTLAAAYPDRVLSPDFSGQELALRLESAKAFLSEQTEPLILVGSSLGGLLAVMLAEAMPGRFDGLLLLAPALHLPEGQVFPTLPKQTVVLAGLQDTIIPAEALKAWCEARQVPLFWVDDDHRLGDSHDKILALLAEMLEAVV